MNPSPFLGVLLHAVGGFAAGSFYIPFRRVRRWAWESYWLVGGVFSWLVAPWVVAYLTCPDPVAVLRESPIQSLLLAYGFGVLWGIGGLTFGLSMRYLGMSLGYAFALGFCAAFGTLIPPLFLGQFPELLSKTSGLVTLAGVAVCFIGIGVCGKAGIWKERELSSEEKTAAIREFSFVKGVWVAVFAGIMSACMAFAIAAGEPVAQIAVAHGSADIWKNIPIFIVILAGGFTTNFIWCAVLNIHNGTARDYVRADNTGMLLANYLFSGLAGVTWYFQFMFYSMGTTQLGRYNFSSWTIHMAFIIVFSNLWAILFREWKGSSKRTHVMIFAGIAVLVLSTIIVGFGNYLAATGSPITE